MTHSLSCLPFCRIWAPTSSLLAMSSSEDPSSCARAFTVQGPRMAEAMVKGLKRVESRPRPLFAPGWYFLHKGKKTGFDEEYAQELQSLLPEHSSGSMPEHSSGSMPEVAVEDACSTGAIIGMVCIGKQLRHSDLPNHQWVQGCHWQVNKVCGTFGCQRSRASFAKRSAKVRCTPGRISFHLCLTRGNAHRPRKQSHKLQGLGRNRCPESDALMPVHTNALRTL